MILLWINDACDAAGGTFLSTPWKRRVSLEEMTAVEGDLWDDTYLYISGTCKSLHVDG